MKIKLIAMANAKEKCKSELTLDIKKVPPENFHLRISVRCIANHKIKSEKQKIHVVCPWISDLGRQSQQFQATGPVWAEIFLFCCSVSKWETVPIVKSCVHIISLGDSGRKPELLLRHQSPTQLPPCSLSKLFPHSGLLLY